VGFEMLSLTGGGRQKGWCGLRGSLNGEFYRLSTFFISRISTPMPARTLTDLLRCPSADSKNGYASSIRHLPNLEILVHPDSLLFEPLQQDRNRRFRDLGEAFKQRRRPYIEALLRRLARRLLLVLVLNAFRIVSPEGGTIHDFPTLTVPCAFTDTCFVRGLGRRVFESDSGGKWITLTILSMFPPLPILYFCTKLFGCLTFAEGFFIVAEDKLQLLHMVKGEWLTCSLRTW
jgi:hypothetical protein